MAKHVQSLPRQSHKALWRKRRKPVVFTALLLCCLVLLGVAAGMVAYGVPETTEKGRVLPF